MDIIHGSRGEIREDPGAAGDFNRLENSILVCLLCD